MRLAPPSVACVALALVACRADAPVTASPAAADAPPAEAVAWSLRSADGRYRLTLQRTQVATVPPSPPTLEGALFDFRQNRPAFALSLADTAGAGNWVGEVYRFDEAGLPVTLALGPGATLGGEASGTIDGAPVRFDVSPLPLALLRREREDVNADYGDTVVGVYRLELLQLASTAPQAGRVNDSLWARLGGTLPRPTDLGRVLDDSLAAWSAAHDRSLADAAAEFAGDPDAGLFAYNESIETVQRVLVADDTLLTVATTDYVYSGGAHGNYGTSYLSVDRRTGDPYALDTLGLDPAARARLDAALDAAARAYLGLAPGAPLDEALFVTRVPLTANVARLPGGWLFGYPPYEIGPYAAGQIELVVWDREWGR